MFMLWQGQGLPSLQAVRKQELESRKLCLGGHAKRTRWTQLTSRLSLVELGLNDSKGNSYPRKPLELEGSHWKEMGAAAPPPQPCLRLLLNGICSRSHECCITVFPLQFQQTGEVRGDKSNSLPQPREMWLQCQQANAITHRTVSSLISLT